MRVETKCDMRKRNGMYNKTEKLSVYAELQEVVIPLFND